MKLADYKKLHQPKESETQTAIINYLESKGYYCQRLNAGSYKTESGYIRGVKGGTPDIMAFKRQPSMGIIRGVLQLLFFEVKRKGNKPTRIQEIKMLELATYGAKCFIATSVEDVIEALRNTV